jgi:hypothetical protein
MPDMPTGPGVAGRRGRGDRGARVARGLWLRAVSPRSARRACETATGELIDWLAPFHAADVT